MRTLIARFAAEILEGGSAALEAAWSKPRPPKKVKKLPKDQTTLEESFASLDRSKQPSSGGLVAGMCSVGVR